MNLIVSDFDGYLTSKDVKNKYKVIDEFIDIKKL